MSAVVDLPREAIRLRLALRRIGVLCLTLSLLWLVLVSSASAHAFLKRSTPDANTVVPQAPPELLMSFTERIEPQFSSAQQFDSNGTLVPAGSSKVGSDATVLILPLPSQLPDGTYTVQWKNVSADDGHSNSGYFAFTVGSQANVVIPSPPTVQSTTLFDRVFSVSGRWLGLLGLAAAIGSFATWLLAIAPAILPLPDDRRLEIAKRLRALALVGAAVALLGSAILLLSQSLASSDSVGPHAIWTVLSSTRFGWYWLVRMALLILLGGALWRREAWSEEARWLERIPVVVLMLLAPIPFSLVSHAAAQPSGRPMAVAVDWLHLLSASIWIGGLLALLVGAVTVAGLQTMQRRVVYASLIPRFSTLAIGSVLVLAITGFYASWLEVGNVSALVSTSYGWTLIVKLILIVPILALGASNLLVWGPGMLKRKQAPERFGRSLTAEVVVAVLILLAVGLLTSLPTARESLGATADHPIFNFDRQGIRATLQITPAVAGLNKYTIDTSTHSGLLPAGTVVLLRVSKNGQIRGQREINVPLLPGSQSRFESQGRDLSVVGDWQIELVVRKPNQADWTVDSHVNVTGSASERVDLPGPPPRFAGLTALVAVLLAGMAVARLLGGLRGDRLAGGRLAAKRLLVGDGLVLVGICGLLLGISWTGPAPTNNQSNPIKMTASSVVTGQSIFSQNCVECHGENGFGDGPKAASLNPPPADFHARHLDDHTDLQLFQWIQNGIPGTAMPSFKGKLTDDQIWNLVNFVRSLRHPTTS
ncbi:MAG: CopD family protein [Nitrolancea sp.]